MSNNALFRFSTPRTNGYGEWPINSRDLLFLGIVKPSLLDVITTNENCHTSKVNNFGTGMSDCQNFTSVQADITILERKAKKKLIV